MNNTKKLGSYDVTTIVIGSLKDVDSIFNVIDAYFDDDGVTEDLLSIKNIFDVRSEKSRLRIESAIKNGFLNFKSETHKDIINCISKSGIPLSVKYLVLFWQFAINNRLFREVTLHVFVKLYLSGKAYLSKEDIIAYIKEIFEKNSGMNISWSESTINNWSAKYLTLMTKFNLLEGVRKKSFININLTSESLVLFLYFAKLYEPDNSNMLGNDFLPLAFIDSVDMLEKLKKLSLKGFFNMDFNGLALNVELIYSYEEICDVLYSRS